MIGKYGSPFHAWKPLPFNTNALPYTLGEAGYATQLLHDTPHLVNGGHGFDYPFHTWTFIRGAEVDRAWMNDEAKWPSNWAKDPLFDMLEDALPTPTIQYARTNRGRENLDDWIGWTTASAASSKPLKPRACPKTPPVAGDHGTNVGERGKIGKLPDHPKNPPNDGILFVDHSPARRGGNLGHALVEYEDGKVLAFYPNCNEDNKGHSAVGWNTSVLKTTAKPGASQSCLAIQKTCSTRGKKEGPTPRNFLPSARKQF